MIQSIRVHKQHPERITPASLKDIGEKRIGIGPVDMRSNWMKGYCRSKAATGKSEDMQAQSA